MKLLYKNCEQCGIEFSIRTWMKNRFCSNLCSNLNKVSTPEKLLEQSKKISVGKIGFKHSQESKDKMSNSRSGKTWLEIYSPEYSEIKRRKIKEVGSRPKTKEQIIKWKKSRTENGWFKNPEETSKRISISNKGKGPYYNKTKDEIAEIVKKTCETKRKNPELIKGGKCKYFKTKIGTVQGKLELNYINNIIENNLPLPRIPKGIRTPFGIYFPDFEYDDKYIEIKSVFTYKVFQKEILGLDKQVSKQKEKLIWVAENIKPVNIFIFDRLYSIKEIIKYPDLDITGRVL